MCDSCGCDGAQTVELGESLLAGNDREAAHNREHFRRHGVLAINLMGSPGSGKTALLEATARAAGGRLRIAAVNGDLATELDAARLERAGIPCRSITTGTACHLDARMVHDALHGLDLDGVDVLFLENVGNLVCPSLFDLGQAANVVALAVTEGEDKPLKYPPMFARADLVVLTKVDLLPYLSVSLAGFESALAKVSPAPAPLPMSATAGAGVRTWLAWLEARRAAVGGRPATATHAATPHPFAGGDAHGPERAGHPHPHPDVAAHARRDHHHFGDPAHGHHLSREAEACGCLDRHGEPVLAGVAAGGARS
jgi:hydrogenase nickel incorporation protein HypB